MHRSSPFRCALAAVFAAIYGSLATLPAQEQEPESNVAEEMAQLTVQLTAADSPADSAARLSNAEVEFNGRIGGDRINQTHTVDAGGAATLKYQRSATVHNLWFIVRAPGYVPANYVWRSDVSAIKLPELQAVELQPAVAIHGQVMDEQGQPIAGAKVDLSLPITWPEVDNYVFSIATELTDQDGRWKCEVVPEDTSHLSIRITHPEFQRNFAQADNKLISTTLKRGLSLTGHVYDRRGEPLPAAQVSFGTDRFGTEHPTAVTDQQGKFTLYNCTPGHSMVTVEATGFAPQMQPVMVVEGETRQQEINFELEPGNTLKLKIVDTRGRPVQGVTVVTDTWRDQRTLRFRSQTAADGTLQWNSAPADTVLCDLLKTGYMAARKIPLIAGGAEQIVTLHPELIISGRVLDAKTKQSVPEFRIIRGQLQEGLQDIYWRRSEIQTFTDGRFSYRVDEPMQGWSLEISADGYRTVQSRLFKSDEGDATFNVLLEPAAGPAGVVVDVHGQPLAGAEVVLVREQRETQIRQGRFDARSSTAEHVTTDANGRFVFAPQDVEEFYLIALHEAGVAEVTASQLTRDPQLKLTPWGRITGQVRSGDHADANCIVHYQPQRSDSKLSYRSRPGFDYTTEADEQGRFSFDRVWPGPGVVARSVVISDGDMTIRSTSSQTAVEVLADQTAAVVVGGGGRTVHGQLALDRQPDDKVRWKYDRVMSLQWLDPQTGNHSKVFRREVGEINNRGEFRVPDVPPGKYQIRTAVSAIAANGRQSGEIGSRLIQVDIPPGEEPFDLGKLTIELLETLDPGEVAPDFVAETLAGGVMRFSELRGKLVVLNFWSVNQPSSVAENTAWAKVYLENFNRDSRVVFLGLSVDETNEQAKNALTQYNWPWMHLHVGPQWATVASRYAVRSLPANFIVGPQGRVLRKNVPGDQLADTLAELLRDKALFIPASEELPPRFPIERFEPPVQANPAAGVVPAALVLDDSDPAFEEGVAHTDKLIAFDKTGRELWRQEKFNVAGSISSRHIVSDAARERIYVGENVGNKLWAFDHGGHPIWCISEVEADCLMLDPSSGNIWCSGGSNYEYGETVAFSPSGVELFALPFHAVDMAFDPHSDEFWLVGYQLLKISREGTVKFRERASGWTAGSIAVHPEDARAWISEYGHSDVPNSHNRLWLRTAGGAVIQQIELQDQRPLDVEWLGDNAALLATHDGGLSQVTTAGELVPRLAGPITSIAVSRDGQQIWLTTDTNLQRLVENEIVVNVPFTDKKCSSIVIIYQ